jgi:hypothetical protein
MLAAPTGRSVISRMPRSKNLRWLAPYTALGYTFVRNGHLSVRDPEGRLVATIPSTPADSEYRGAKATLRRHERQRKAG